MKKRLLRWFRWEELIAVNGNDLKQGLQSETHSPSLTKPARE